MVGPKHLKRSLGQAWVWLDASVLSVIKLALINYRIQLQCVEVIVFRIQSTCCQSWSQPLTHSGSQLAGVLRGHSHGYGSAYRAACVPTASTLLRTQPHKRRHFIFVPATISHVFSRRSWLIPRWGPAGPQHAGLRVSQRKKVLSALRDVWFLWWRSTNFSKSLSTRRVSGPKAK